MKWKDFPTWLKGGIIGVIIGILTFLVGYFYQELTKDKIRTMLVVEKRLWLIILIFFPVLISLLILELMGIGDKYLVIVLLLSLIIYFLIGAFIGWIVGKIKPKKKS